MGNERKFRAILPERYLGQVGIHAGTIIELSGDGHHVNLVYLVELLRFSDRRTGHTGELRIHAEEVLQRDGRVSGVLSLNGHTLFGLHSLMQTVGPAPARHHPPSEIVHNHHMAAAHQIILVALEDEFSPQRLLKMRLDLRLFRRDIFRSLRVAQ